MANEMNIRNKLSIFMFFEFFIWGAWYVTMGTYLGTFMSASGAQVSQAYSTQSWGAILAPFVIGLIADKYFNAEKLLGLLHISGGILMYFLYQSQSFDSFYPLIFVYMVLYMPTLSLANSVAFQHLKDPVKDFAPVRVWGTIGWIVVGLSISYIFSWDSAEGISTGMLKYTFLLTSISSLLLGIGSFFLPPTPPKFSKGQKVDLKQLLGLDALKLFLDKNYLIFFISSILICIPLAFYYSYTNPFLVDLNIANPTGKMTIGQISEVAFMLLLPLFFKRYGFKNTILVGMFAWAVRYILFALGDGGTFAFNIILGIALHGLCYDFFFVSGQIYTNAKAGDSIKSSAQGLITLATYGIGMLIGFWAAGKIVDTYTGQWDKIWLIPAVFSLGVMVLFWLFFKREKVEYEDGK
jgi:nucleoside transporter